jgi:hypothetical protein
MACVNAERYLATKIVRPVTDRNGVGRLHFGRPQNSLDARPSELLTIETARSFLQPTDDQHALLA